MIRAGLPRLLARAHQAVAEAAARAATRSATAKGAAGRCPWRARATVASGIRSGRGAGARRTDPAAGAACTACPGERRARSSGAAARCDDTAGRGVRRRRCRSTTGVAVRGASVTSARGSAGAERARAACGGAGVRCGRAGTGCNVGTRRTSAGGATTTGDGGGGATGTLPGTGSGSGGSAGPGDSAADGRNSSGSRYPCGSATRRTPRCTYGTDCSGTPLDPAEPITSPSSTAAPRSTASAPRCKSVTE